MTDKKIGDTTAKRSSEESEVESQLMWRIRGKIHATFVSVVNF